MVQLCEKPSRVTPFQWKGHLTCSRLSFSGEDAKEYGKRGKVKGTRFIFHFPAFLSPRGPDFLLSGCLEQAKGHPLSGQNISPCINTFALPAGSTWLRRDNQSAHKRYCHPWLEQKGSIFFNARLASVDLARRVILVCQRIEKST